MKIFKVILLLVFGIGGAIISFWGLLGNSVSKKYELADPEDCISLTSGNDLCLIENILIGTFIFSIALFFFGTYTGTKRKKTNQ